MKSKIIILSLISLIFIISNTISQNWVNNFDFTGSAITQMHFLNPNTGYVTTRSDNTIKVWKSVNKGISWSQIKEFVQSGFIGSATTYLLFVNETIGYFAYVPTDRVYTIIEKTTNGGSSWAREVDNSGIPLAEHPLIIFRSSNEGYFFANSEYDQTDIKVYRTFDGFETFSHIHTETPPYRNSFHLNDVMKDNNNILLAVGWNSLGNYYQYSDAFKLTYYQNFNAANGSENTQLKYLYGAFLNSQQRFLGVQSQGNYTGTRFYPDFNNQQTSIQIDPEYSETKIGGMTFSNDSKGFVTVGNKIYITNNSGINWSEDGTLSTDVYSFRAHNLIKSFGDVSYAASSGGKYHTRLISGNYNTNFDWRTGMSGSIAVDGENLPTPGEGYFRGGTVSLYANKYLINPMNGTEACFYYWGGNCSGSMSNSSVSYLINSGSYINADYKTKLNSQDVNSIRGATQTKVIKDTSINSVSTIHLINQGMGGIFYTKSTDNGTSFKREEVVNYNASRNDYLGNKNACMNIIRCYNNPVTIYDQERNIAVAWERYNPNTGKDEIKVAVRWLNPINQEPYWSTYEDYNAGIFTSFTAGSDFEAKPKIFVREVGGLNNEYYYL